MTKEQNIILEAAGIDYELKVKFQNRTSNCTVRHQLATFGTKFDKISQAVEAGQRTK